MMLISPVTAFLVLPALQVLSLWAPPFPGRSIVFVSAIVACAVILHSERVSDDPQVTYGLGMAWPTYLATIDRLLFSVPEAAFWRVGEKPGEALGYGMFGWKKLQWSAGQIFNPRGIHWNYQVKGIARAEGKQYRSRKAFMKSHAIQFIKICLGYDILHSFLVSQHRHIGSIGGDYTPLSDHPFIRSFATTAAAAYVMFCGIQLNHLLTSITFVGLGLSRPEDWPPLYGNFWDAFTVRRVWGCFWHKLIRRTLSSYAKFAVRTLQITDETNGAIVHLILTFTLSGIFHALPLRVMLGPDHHGLPLGTIFFFASQAIAILFEEAVISWYVRATGGHTEGRMWHKIVGFLWTTMWLYWSLPFFLDDMFASGMMDASTIPFSVARAVAGVCGFVLKS